MKKGKVYKGNVPFCSYKESGYRISTLMMGNPGEVSNPNAYPEAVGDPFKDYSFGTEYQSFVTAKAKIFASAHELYIVYFYNIRIRFETMDLELNVRYNPMLIRTLAQDMVKYDVINGNFVNEKNMHKLIDKWNEKNGLLNTTHLQQGIVNNYNSGTPTPAEKPQSINIRIAGDKIYRNDTLMGYYRMDMHLPLGNLHGSSKNNYLYRIEDTTGKFIAWV
ncbi:MAG: hypothetical protein KDC07_07770, partial [Chitinophagaceae bacterium]|nr:hypothetical protein [Chitinophagaceae bacterium]